MTFEFLDDQVWKSLGDGIEPPIGSIKDAAVGDVADEGVLDIVIIDAGAQVRKMTS